MIALRKSAASVLVAIVAALSLSRADAQTAPIQGAACGSLTTALGINGSTTPTTVVQPAAGNNLVCVSGTWQYPAYQFGSTAASCNSTNAGAVQYTSGVLEACNGTSWIPIDGGMHFISTQTASSSASLQFSGTNWSSDYNTLFLNCTGIRMSATNNTFDIQIGEGAGPTWETGAHYNVTGQTATATGMMNGSFPQAAGTKTSIRVLGYLDTVSSSALYKTFSWMACSSDSASGCGANTWDSSWWTNDTNPVTGLRIVAQAGTIASGTCSLYGMN